MDSVQLEKKRYEISSTSRICLARALDIVLSSVPLFALGLTMKFWGQGQWWAGLIMIVVAAIFLISYFVVVPYFWQGRTFGKVILRLRLVQRFDHMRWRDLWYRELIIIFIPWLLQLTLNLILDLAYGVNLGLLFQTTKAAPVAYFLLRAATVFYFLWYLGLIFGVAFDPHHQLFCDRQLKIYICRWNEMTAIKPQPQQPLSKSPLKHVHLGTDQPGNIDLQLLKVANQDDLLDPLVKSKKQES